MRPMMKKALYLFWGLNALVCIAAGLCIGADAYQPGMIGPDIGKDANIVFSIFIIASMIWTVWLGTHSREPGPGASNDIFDITRAISLNEPRPQAFHGNFIAIMTYSQFLLFEFYALRLGSRFDYALLAIWCLLFALAVPLLMRKFLANSIYDRPAMNKGATGGQEA
jgi:hypothetical protein